MASHPLQSLIDIQMQQAERAGKFNNLPGQGKPIANLGARNYSVLDHMLVEAKAKPPFVEFRRQAAVLRTTLSDVTDADERKTLMTRIADLETRAAIEFEAFTRHG